MSKQPTHKVTITEGVVPLEPKRQPTPPTENAVPEEPLNLESLPYVLQRMCQTIQAMGLQEPPEEEDITALIAGAMQEWDQGLWRWNESFVEEMKNCLQRIQFQLAEPQLKDRQWTLTMCTLFTEFVKIIEKGKEDAVETAQGEA